LSLSFGAAVTGAIEMIAGFAVGLDTMLGFMRSGLAESGPVLMEQVINHDVDPRTTYELFQVQGAMLWVMFFLSPMGLLVAFAFCEGMARFLAATVTRQVCGVLPLWLLDGACRLVARPAAKARHRSSPMDVLVKDGEGLLASIQSALRYPWDRTTTLRFEGRLYVVAEQSSSHDRDRPYRYRVRPAPLGHLVRALTDYPPPSVSLEQPGEQTAPAPDVPVSAAVAQAPLATRLLGTAVAFALAPSVSVLPLPWRQWVEDRVGRLPLRFGTVVTGAVEIGVAYTVGGFQIFNALLVAPPIGAVLVFLLLEGVVRIMAAMHAKQACGTLPLWLLERLHRRATRPRATGRP
jgi:hypothetical protein